MDPVKTIQSLKQLRKKTGELNTKEIKRLGKPEGKIKGQVLLFGNGWASGSLQLRPWLQDVSNYPIKFLAFETNQRREGGDTTRYK